MERGNQYKYLGVTITDQKGYMVDCEEEIRMKVCKAKGYIGKVAMWGYSRYDLTREVWKMVSVPRMTFANSVLVLSSRTRECMEQQQINIGRMALQAHRCTPSEAVQGDMGWSTFEAREAKSKLRYERRLSTMEEERWPRQVWKALHLGGTNTRWTLRMRQLGLKFKIPTEMIYNKSKGQQSDISKAVQEAETEMWRAKMETKSALQVYRSWKVEIGKEVSLYDNGRASGLLFEARSGMLRTRTLQGKFKEVEQQCSECGTRELETIEHVILTCTAYGQRRSVTVAEALGFLGPEGDAVNRGSEVAQMKRRLESWWRRTRESHPSAPMEMEQGRWMAERYYVGLLAPPALA